MKKLIYSVAASLLLMLPSCTQDDTIEVTTLAEFATLVAQDNQSIKLMPGTYKMADYINADTIQNRVARKDYQYLKFSGNNNSIDMEGVVFEIDTKLRKLLKHPIHTDEILLSGDNNTITGLEVKHIGETTSPGGCAFTINGQNNRVNDLTLRVQGSAPYGYGDLFGKGKEHVIKHQKHSGLLITGSGTTVSGANIYMRSFGHAIFIQQGPSDVTLMDCYCEGEMRSTNDVLAETSGPAYDVEFRTWTPNREGEFVVTPNYMKSLCEEGFRTYAPCKNLKMINCTAKNTRGGFELRSSSESVYLENCTAIGCERSFWIGEGAIVKGCKGDANYGPLLFVEGNNCDVEMSLIANESDCQVHSLITVFGTNNTITLNPYEGINRTQELPILVGYTQPEHGESMSPYSQADCTNLKLTNNTSMAVVVGHKSHNHEIESKGEVTNE
ncbi:MAG: hypothetical protein SNG02_06020 [Rikenellaceae bacterium]